HLVGQYAIDTVLIKRYQPIHTFLLIISQLSAHHQLGLVPSVLVLFLVPVATSLQSLLPILHLVDPLLQTLRLLLSLLSFSFSFFFLLKNLSSLGPLLLVIVSILVTSSSSSSSTLTALVS